MTLVVQKFGGTSVGDPDRIRNVARRVVSTAEAGADVCVAVSAMGRTTDELLDLAVQVSERPHPRELDMLLTAGERISIALLSMAIMDLGRHAISFTASQAGIVTDAAHGKARILDIRSSRVLQALEKSGALDPGVRAEADGQAGRQGQHHARRDRRSLRLEGTAHPGAAPAGRHLDFEVIPNRPAGFPAGRFF